MAETDTDIAKIEIRMDGGVVTSVSGVPDGAVVEIRDYDTDGADPDDSDTLYRDSDGDDFFFGVYDNDGYDQAQSEVGPTDGSVRVTREMLDMEV